MSHELSDEQYYTGLALADADGVQSYRYKGTTWRADDIYEAMTRAAVSQESEAPQFITADVGGKYQVLKRYEKTGNYVFFCNTGDSFAAARLIANTMNKE